MSKDDLVSELYDCSRTLRNQPYAAPEQVEYARKFIATIENDLGFTAEEILADPDIINDILDERTKNYKPKFFGKLIKVTSTHRNLDDSYEGGFDALPKVGNRFDFTMAPVNLGRNIITSKVREVQTLGDDEILFHTNNSTYKLVYHQ
jgi:hypothetical protein